MGAALPEQTGSGENINLHVWSQKAFSFVKNLWDDDRSIFHFEREHWRTYLELLEEERRAVERSLEDLNKIMAGHWDRMDRYWF
mmetsp:Transcript_4171/g.7074  ORF Transcript_4171/g.7074 Transcript_4171/m.7074 type:complete len:84 (-) Transcript_4171:227-478(-)